MKVSTSNWNTQRFKVVRFKSYVLPRATGNHLRSEICVLLFHRCGEGWARPNFVALHNTGNDDKSF